jgi:hypothetical protein
VTEYEQDWSVSPSGAGGEFSLDDVRHLVSGMDGRQKSALAMYRVHREARTLDQYRLVTYRCPRRCLLLDVFRTPAGPAVYFPPFKLSEEHNQRTAEDARIERTSDGVRRWIERAEMLAIFKSGLYLELNCDHVSRHILTGDEITATITAANDTVIVQE